MKRLALTVAAIITAAATTPAAAQLKIAPSYAPHEPIVAEYLPAIPTGAQLQATWSVTKPAALIQTAPTTAAIWAAPGAYDLTITGIWIKTHEATIGDQPAQVLEAFGLINATAAFKVQQAPTPKPPTPPPAPPPTPTKPTKLTVAIVEESANRTPAQAGIILSPKLADWAKAGGHKVYAFDKDQDAERTSYQCQGRQCRPVTLAAADPEFRPLITAAKGKTVPRLIAADQATGKILANLDLPATIEATISALKTPAGEK